LDTAGKWSPIDLNTVNFYLNMKKVESENKSQEKDDELNDETENESEKKKILYQRYASILKL